MIKDNIDQQEDETISRERDDADNSERGVSNSSQSINIIEDISIRGGETLKT